MQSLSRRRFLQVSSIAGTCLVIGCAPSVDGEEVVVIDLTSDIGGVKLNQFIAIARDNRIALFNHRPEMGQGTFQSIPMILAEELEVDIDSVLIRQSPADRELYGSQMVVGSRSIQSQFDTLRKMGATARELLRQAAANIWETDIESCVAENGAVTNKTGERLKYGELIEEASRLEPMTDPPLKSPSEFKVIGTSVARQDIPVKTNGQAVFGIDISVPGMLYASIERSPTFVGKLRSYDDAAALQVPGVRHVFQTSRELFGRNIEGVAVLADSYWAAEQGRRALEVYWEPDEYAEVDNASILSESYDAARRDGDELFGRGRTLSVINTSDEVFQSTYEMPYQAHVPMEPMNAIVRVGENDIEYWGSTQNPNGFRSFLARKYNMDESAVTINYTFMGGGFGRRSRTDVPEEAADLSVKAGGVPVKVIWTREDDQTQGPFRQCSLNVLRAVMGRDGKVIALEHKVIAQEIRNQTGDDMTAGRQLMGGITTAYTIPNMSVRGLLMKRHIPISYWRAVYHSTNPFAHESFIDELANEAGKDPLQFRLDMLTDERFRRVLEETATRTGWFDAKEEGTGRGLAICERSGAHFAMVMEVRRVDGLLKPVRVTTVLDLGICVNPDTVRAQVEGSIAMGLGACYAGLNVQDGAIVEKNFDQYPLLRIDQCPEIVTHILESEAPPDGAGESGLPTVAPALANAIFDLTGRRIRKLPVDLAAIV